MMLLVVTTLCFCASEDGAGHRFGGGYLRTSFLCDYVACAFQVPLVLSFSVANALNETKHLHEGDASRLVACDARLAVVKRYGFTATARHRFCYALALPESKT